MSIVNSNTFSKTFSIDNNVSIVVLFMLSTQPIRMYCLQPFTEQTVGIQPQIM